MTTSPNSCRGFRYPAAVIGHAVIAVSAGGRFLYASSRGFDFAVVLTVTPDTSSLTTVDSTPSAGKPPRFFVLDSTSPFMFVANGDSDTTIKSAVDGATGKLTPTDGVMLTGSPGFIVFRSAT